MSTGLCKRVAVVVVIYALFSDENRMKLADCDVPVELYA